MECTKCRRKNIKYHCIGCRTPICNVCSMSCAAETPGYCEENYLVGKCEECHGNYRKQKGSGSLPLSKPAGQSSLSSFLKVKTKSPVLHVEKDARKDKSWPHHASSPSSSSTEECASTFTLAPVFRERNREIICGYSKSLGSNKLSSTHGTGVACDQ